MRPGPATWPAGPCRPGRTGVRHLARHMVMGLTVQFLLGMAVNLLGLPSQATGAARAASTVFLVAHVVIALGMAAGAVMVIRAGAGPRSRWRLETWGAAAIAVTIAAGILTMVTKSNWWSYVLALGFIASLLTYGGLLVRVRPSRPPAG